MNGKEIKERKIAVDWALSKEKFEEVKAQQEPVKEEPVDGEEGVKQEEGSDVEMKAEDDDESEEEDEDDDVDVEMDDEEEEKPVKPTLPAVEEGSTLFIRNLPFEATEEELRDL